VSLTTNNNDLIFTIFVSMKCLIQRVLNAAVKVNNKEVAAIEKGLLVFLGVGNEDDLKMMETMVKKITQLRIFNDEQGKMNHSVMDVNGEILLVSQFTLYADCKKGNRPSYIQAAAPAFAETIFASMAEEFEKILKRPVGKGIFGADMKVSLVNDGPVTIWLEM